MLVTPPVKVPPKLQVSDGQFQQFVHANPDLKLERTADGQLIFMAPTGSESGYRNFELYLDMGNWNRQARAGKAFDSSTGFRLPNGAIRSPDLAWINIERWQSLTSEQRQSYAPICPDFVMELASETDSLETLQAKMQEYLDNGCRLGWLINPKTETVEVYRPLQPVEVVSFSTPLSGEAVLPGFILDLQMIFSS